MLTYWAEPVVRLLFADAYLTATPYFQVFLLMMVRQSHRALHQCGIIIALMPKYGLRGPTLGLVVVQACTSIYLGSRVLSSAQLLRR